MATMAAIRSNPVIKVLHSRLIASGKLWDRHGLRPDTDMSAAVIVAAHHAASRALPVTELPV